MLKLIASPLTRAAFAPFGDVIQTEGAESFPINKGSTERYHDLATVQLHGKDACALISIFRGQPVALPFTVRMLERHPLGSQAFMPLNNRPYLVVVAKADSAPDSDAIHGFIAQGDQGVNYHAGIWHHPLLPLEQDSDFLVVDRGGAGDNCDEYILPQPIVLHAPD